MNHDDRLAQIERTCVMEELVRGIAHELNQPLGAIATFARAAERMLARDDPMVFEARDVLGLIAQAALSAGDDVRRVRSSVGAAPAELVRCDMAEVIEEILPELHRIAARHHGIMCVNIGGESLTVVADRLRLQYVVLALVENAFEAEGEGGRTPANVSLSAAHRGQAVRVDVVDRAKGVPRDVRERLFRPFVTTKGRVGLGLAACRSVVEAHGGRIGFDDEPGGGSRFWFELPGWVVAGS